MEATGAARRGAAGQALGPPTPPRSRTAEPPGPGCRHCCGSGPLCCSRCSDSACTSARAGCRCLGWRPIREDGSAGGPRPAVAPGNQQAGWNLHPAALLVQHAHWLGLASSLTWLFYCLSWCPLPAEQAPMSSSLSRRRRVGIVLGQTSCWVKPVCIRGPATAPALHGTPPARRPCLPAARARQLAAALSKAGFKPKDKLGVYSGGGVVALVPVHLAWPHSAPAAPGVAGCPRLTRLLPPRLPATLPCPAPLPCSPPTSCHCSQQRGVDAVHPRLRCGQRHHRCACSIAFPSK